MIEQVPLAFVTESRSPATAQPVEAPALKVTAPVPLPPLAVSVVVLPYVRVAGALTVSVAWVAICTVRVKFCVAFGETPLLAVMVIG